MKKHLFPLLLIIFLFLWLVSSLLRPGWFASHDGLYHLRRVGEMSEMLKLGYFPVRWGLTLDNFYGIPIFNYVYPGPYYLASFLTLLTPLGVPTVLKLLALGSFLGGGLAWYSLFAQKSKVLGVGAAILYLTTPYHLVNLFVRFALGEIVVLSLLPWVLLINQYLDKKKQLTWFTSLPLFFALISHSFLGILGIGLVLFYSFFAYKNFALIVKNTLLSFFLSSFFLLPLFVERNLVLSGATQDYSFRYSDHFIFPGQLLYSRWDYWYSMPGIINDGMTFQLGFAAIATFALFLVFAFRKFTRLSVVLLILFLLTLFFLLPFSQSIWDLLPFLQVIQFPWRLLGLIAFLVPLILSQVILNLPKRSAVSVFLVTGLLVLGLINVRNYRLPRKFLNSEEFATEYALIKDKTATSLRGELVPKWASTERWQNQLVTAEGIDLTIDPSSNQGQIIFTAITSTDSSAIVHKNYFPSWQGRVDGEKLKLSPAPDGSISFPLSAGSHQYKVFLGSTPIELLGNFMSLLALLYLFILKFRHATI